MVSSVADADIYVTALVVASCALTPSHPPNNFIAFIHFSFRNSHAKLRSRHLTPYARSCIPLLPDISLCPSHKHTLSIYLFYI